MRLEEQEGIQEGNEHVARKRPAAGMRTEKTGGEKGSQTVEHPAAHKSAGQTEPTAGNPIDQSKILIDSEKNARANNPGRKE